MKDEDIYERYPYLNKNTLHYGANHGDFMGLLDNYVLGEY